MISIWKPYASKTHEKVFHMFGDWKQLEEIHVHLTKRISAFVHRCDPFLLHDKIRLNFSRITHQNITGLAYETLSHPPYILLIFQPPTTIFKASTNFIEAGITFCSQTVAETEFKDILKSKPLDFYQKGINNFVTW